MTDDDAFLRAMIAAPGDELPRPVYADWLDDRGDPRGAYLRQESDAVRAEDWAGLGDAAAGLDPVWVARVSRPPAGVSCELLTRSDIRRVITPADLEYCEKELGVPLPDQLQALLLNCNPHNLKAGRFAVPDKSREYEVNIYQFVGYDDPDRDEDYFDGDILDQVDELQGEYNLPKHLIFLASCGSGETFMVSGGETDGGVVLLAGSLGDALNEPGTGITRYAGSIGEFLHRLEPVTRLRPGDTPAIPEDQP